MRRWIVLSVVCSMAGCAGEGAPRPGAGGDAGGGPPVGSDAGAPEALTDGGGDVSPDAGGPEPEPDPGPGSFAEIDDLALYIVVGDSIAAGYDASGRNGEGGQAFARLLVDNHPSRPDWSERALRHRWPGVDFRQVAESGADSHEVLSNLRSALGGSLPASVPGDVLVSINAGGNDFNDSVATILDPTRTAATAAEVKANILEMIRLLRERYEDRDAGKRVVVLVHDLHDPTDGTGRIPGEFDDGFCETIQNPLFTDGLRSTALANLETMNVAIREAAAEGDGYLVPVHDGFVGHGMNGGATRWLSGDCTHPTDEGHHQLRRLVWQVLEGP